MDITVKVISYLQKNGPTSCSQISKDLSVNRVTLTKYLQVMKVKSQVDFEEKGMAKLWKISSKEPEKKEVLQIPKPDPKDILSHLTRDHNELISVGNTYVAILPFRFFSTLFMAIKKTNPEWQKVIYEAGKELGQQEVPRYLRFYGQGTNNELTLKKIIDAHLVGGWGKLKSIKLDSKNVFIELSHSVSSKLLDQKPSCFLQAGFFAGVASALFKTNYFAKETECGENNICKFIIEPETSKFTYAADSLLRRPKLRL